MLFQFAPAIQAGINSGVYEIVRNNATGALVGIARDKVTGQFVGHAIGITAQAISSINPLFAPANLVMGGLQMAQTHLGFQKTYTMLNTLGQSVAVLQSTTNLIGLGAAVGVVLSAVNLHQTLKLRKDVKQLRLEVKGGFIDLKEALNEQGRDVIKRIDEVANDIKFAMYHQELAKAYGLFATALERFKNALILKDFSELNSEIKATRNTLFDALAVYDNPRLLGESCSAGKLRKQECVWAIEQAITMTFQVQGASEMVSHRLYQLQDKIRNDLLAVVNECQEEDELDFLFPEFKRIHDHDLAVLNSWQNHLDWSQSLSPSELKDLQNTDFTKSEFSGDFEASTDNELELEPPEQLEYKNLKQKSHYFSLRDQLKFIVKPELRQEHEFYIIQQATTSGLNALAPDNWQKISDLTVANLYWYFKSQLKAAA